ncbi:DUF4377 domain-containing protein [Aureibaculum sp. A20]|uniref:DUF4377 domain-containing protein n=1 Tax=Aureibaculum flavum TaxID=2795986 RepID=A0ABS0WP68_9FLAO|nr:DUF4377 domain-containing protein [Aureibaculum flavum]MBJ2173788.1 DUF4377 domain-containing protein [Aureibaculum flavum]
MKFISVSVILFLACLISISSCTSDDDVEIVTLKVNHFKQSGVGSFTSQFLLVYEGSDAGDAMYNMFYSGIEGFNYEWGYVYTLTVEKKTIGNIAADGGSISYKLIDEVGKEKAASDISFEILLSRTYDDGGFEPFFTKTDNSTFELLDGTKIDCANLCDQLTEKLAVKEAITGVFLHSENIGLELTALK